MSNNNKPTMDNTVNEKNFDIDSFTSKLQKEDEKQLRLSKGFLWIYIAFIGLYSIFVVLFLFEGKSLIEFLSQLFYILSFIAFVLLFRNNLKTFKSIDYSAPLAMMLKGVVERYKLKLNYFLVLSIPILLMDAGLTLSFYHDLSPIAPINRILIVQAIYLPIMTISALIGVLIWRKKQKPLYDHALSIIKELEE